MLGPFLNIIFSYHKNDIEVKSTYVSNFHTMYNSGRRGGLVVSALVPGLSGPGSSPGQGDTVLCSWARHFTLTVPPSTQEYKWVPAKCSGNLTNCWGVTCDGLASRPGGVEILLAASCYGNQVKLWPDEPVLAPKASLFSLTTVNV